MKFYVIRAFELITSFGLTGYNQQLRNYLNGGREDILDHPSFFEDNCCTRMRGGDFSELQRETSVQEADIVIIGLYLELLEYWGERRCLIQMIQSICKQAYPKRVIGFWCHDTDFSNMNQYLPPNITIINTGYTSNPSKHDILIPFWNIQSNPYSLPKTHFASFIGTANNPLRQKLVNSILEYNNPDIQYKRVYDDAYLRELSSTLFVLCPKGGPGSGGFSYRVFEALEAGSIPVIIVDILHFPMKELIPWESICVRIPETMVTDMSSIHSILKSVNSEEMLEAIRGTKATRSFRAIQKYIHDEIKLVV